MALFLFFDVDLEGFVDVHGLVEEGFVIINYGFGDEGKLIKNMEDNVVKSVLIVSFIQVPEFHEVIIRDHVDEEMLRSV